VTIRVAAFATRQVVAPCRGALMSGRTHHQNSADELLTRKEVAELLGVGAQTVRVWAVRRYGPPYMKRKGRCLYRRDDVEAFAAARRGKGARHAT